MRRRLLLFALLLVVVAGVAGAIAPRDQNTAVAPVNPAPGASLAKTVQATLPVEKRSSSRIHAHVGDVVQLDVQNPERDVVDIVALGIHEPVEAGLPAQVVFDADRPGRFAVTLRDAGRRIGTIDVRPGR